jgi:hypothetical protein
MENETNFDLNVAISKWRSGLESTSSFRSKELDELELHLRDSFEALRARGIAQPEAWWLARKRLGEPQMIDEEFGKVNPGPRLPARFLAMVSVNEQLVHAATSIERNVIVPSKIAGLAMLACSFYSSPWFMTLSSNLDVGVQLVQNTLSCYIGLALISGVLLLRPHRLRPEVLYWTIFSSIVIDVVFLSIMLIAFGNSGIVLTLFLAIVLRNTLVIPIRSLVSLNLCSIIGYIFAAATRLRMSEFLDDPTRFLLNGADVEVQTPVILQATVLILFSVCCYCVRLLVIRRTVGGAALAH